MSLAQSRLIAELVRETRQRLELTQEFAAKLGVSDQSVNRWGNGRTKLPIALKLIEMLQAMGKQGQNLLIKHLNLLVNSFAVRH